MKNGKVIRLPSFPNYISEITLHYESAEFFKKWVSHILNIRNQRYSNRNTNAAILLTLIVPNWIGQKSNFFDYIYILFEKRGKHLSNNPGDMSFPGGRTDNNDNSLIETAYREANEELGLLSTNLEFLGYLDEFISASGIVVRVVVAWSELNCPEMNSSKMSKYLQKKFSPRTKETDFTLAIPLSHFLNPKNYFSFCMVRYNNKITYVRYYNIHEYHLNQHIWGLTASVLRRFADSVILFTILPQEPMNLIDI